MNPTLPKKVPRRRLEEIYVAYNARKWVPPDPLETLYAYPDLRDREIVGLLASSLAYGRVAQILRSLSAVLRYLGPSPHHFLKSCRVKTLKNRFGAFRHRFTTGQELVALFEGVKGVVARYGSLYDCFLHAFRPEQENILPALCAFVHELRCPSGNRPNSLLPEPEKGSACKRLNLYLRWMVREDRVDPGGWREISPGKLIIPLDTHMYRIAVQLNLTRRKSADMRTAMEITRAFQEVAPRDPVRYDFALTRLGIREDGDLGAFLKKCGVSCHPVKGGVS